MYNLVLKALNYLLLFVQYALFARAILSWLPISGDNALVRLLHQLTEPILAPIRKLIEKSALGKNLMLDLSVIVAFILIGLIRSLIFGRSVLF